MGSGRNWIASALPSRAMAVRRLRAVSVSRRRVVAVEVECEAPRHSLQASSCRSTGFAHRVRRGTRRKGRRSTPCRTSFRCVRGNEALEPSHLDTVGAGGSSETGASGTATVQLWLAGSRQRRVGRVSARSPAGTPRARRAREPTARREGATGGRSGSAGAGAFDALKETGSLRRRDRTQEPLRVGVGGREKTSWSHPSSTSLPAYMTATSPRARLRPPDRGSRRPRPRRTSAQVAHRLEHVPLGRHIEAGRRLIEHDDALAGMRRPSRSRPAAADHPRAGGGSERRISLSEAGPPRALPRPARRHVADSRRGPGAPRRSASRSCERG